METYVSDIKPGHYYISDGLTKEKGWPIDDKNTIVATLLVIGRLNNPTTAQGYRVFLLFTNKSKFFILTQWWKENLASDDWKEVQLSTIS